MSVFRSPFLLLLGLLVAVPGCSGGRMRQVFTPDREFMTLSELQEYDKQQDIAADESKSTRGFLASLTRDKRDDTDDSDEATDEKRERLLSLSRWLPSAKAEDLPTDPFVGIDQDADEDTDVDAEADRIAVADADSEESVTDNYIISTGLARDLPSDEQTPANEDTSFSVNPFEAAATESAVAATPDAAPAADDSLPTFADIMMEFEDEDESDSTDELDAMAEAWLAGQSGAADDSSASDSELTDFEALLAEAEQAVTPATPAASDELPGLDFDMPQDDSSLTADEPELPKTAANSSTIQQLIDSSETAIDPDQLAEAEPFDEFPVRLPTENRIRHNDEPEAEQPLWPSSGVAQNQPPVAPRTPITQPAPSTTAAADDLMGSWDFGPPQDSSRVAMGRPAPPSEEIEAVRSDFRPPAYSHPATGLQSESGATEPVGIPSVATSDVFDDTRFLNDFEQQAEAAADTPATAPTEPAAATGGSFISRTSPRTWLLILGAAIIGYLLLAPERQNLRQTNNR